MTSLGRKYESFEADAQWWGEFGHQNRALSLSPLIRTQQDARMLMEIVSAGVCLCGWEDSDQTYAERAYDLIGNWDSWDLAEARLCHALLTELEGRMEELVKEYGSGFSTTSLYLSMLIQAINNRCWLLSKPM